jgi:hypothetical protein
MIAHLARLAALLVLLFAGAALAEESKPVEPNTEAMAAARELLEATGADTQVDNMIAALSGGAQIGAKGQGESGKEAVAAMDGFLKKFAGYKTEMLNDMVIASMPVLMQKGSEIGRKYAEKIVQDMASEKKK